MIGSVTKLTLYAVSLAATYKDGVQKRDALLKDRLSPATGLMPVECVSHISHATAILYMNDERSIYQSRYMNVTGVLLLVIKYKNSEQLYTVELKN